MGLLFFIRNRRMSKSSSSISWEDSEARPLLTECWEKSGSLQTMAETEHSVGSEAWKVAGAIYCAAGKPLRRVLKR